MSSGAQALAPARRGWSPWQVGLGALLAALLVPALIVAGPAVLVVGGAVGIIAWLSARPARGLAIFCWLLPFHILAMALLYGGLGLSEGVVRTLAAWKEMLLAACVVAAIVHVLRRPPGSIERPLTVTWIDGAVAALVFIAVSHLIAAGPWLGSVLTPVGKAYAFRDIAFFLLLYFVGRVSGRDVADNDATLSRLFTVGVITGGAAIIEYAFIPQALLAAVGVSRYFNEFLNVPAFTSNNAFGLPDNSMDVIGNTLVRRAGSTYLMSTGFATAQIIPIAAASVLIFRRDRRAGFLRVLGYALAWIGLLLSITRMSIAASLAEALVIAIWYRRRTAATAVVAGLVIAGITAVAVVPGLSNFLWDTLTFRSESSLSHIGAWTTGFDVALAHPFGAGLGTTDETAFRFSPDAPLTGDNLFFKYSAELGIPAFLVHILALIGIGQAGWVAARRGLTPARQRLGVAVLAMTIGVMINGMTAVLYNSTFLAYIYFWLAGSAVTVAQETRGRPAR